VNQLFYIGSYTKKGGYFPKINGEGLTVWSLDINSGQMRKLVTHENIVNSTYMTKLRDDLLLIASDEYFDPGNIIAYRIENGITLRKLSSQSTLGTATCHVSTINGASPMVFVTSYLDSKLSVYELSDDNLMPAQFIYQFKGNGPNKDRQEDSHAHCAIVSPSGRWLYVCDLGSDSIWLLDLENLTGEESDFRKIELPPGYGPRHLVFSEKHPLAYLICELNAHVLTLRYNDKTGLLELIDDIPTLPKDYTGLPSASAIRLHPNGKTLYISNRIHNSISVFSVDQKSGELFFETRFNTKGDEPRDFNIDPSGKWLICANQNSDTLTSFELDVQTGLPKHDNQAIVACGTPVCVIF